MRRTPVTVGSIDADGSVTTPAIVSASSPGGGRSFDAVIFAFAASRAPPTLVHGSSASQRPSPSPSGHGRVVVVVDDEVLVELVDMEVLDDVLVDEDDDVVVGSAVVDVVELLDMVD